MYDFVTAVFNPALFGYDSPRSDLVYGLQNRFVMSFNTQNAAQDFCKLLLTQYHSSPLKNIPLFTGEYKSADQSMPESPMALWENDFRTMHNWVKGQSISVSANMSESTAATCNGVSKPVRGFNVFEIQVAYEKADLPPEERQMVFGVLELGKHKVGETPAKEETQWETYDVWCFHHRRNNEGKSWVEVIPNVLNGKLDDDSSCPLDSPAKLVV
jgi:hypothetical protein